LQAFLE